MTAAAEAPPPTAGGVVVVFVDGGAALATAAGDELHLGVVTGGGSGAGTHSQRLVVGAGDGGANVAVVMGETRPACRISLHQRQVCFCMQRA